MSPTLTLAGVQVADVTQALSGPYCTMLLDELGADVINVEMPGRGDDSRYWGPPFVGDTSAYFLAVNRSKRSITLDPCSAHGRRDGTPFTAGVPVGDVAAGMFAANAVLAARLPRPVRGQHTEEILRELGIEPDDQGEPLSAKDQAGVTDAAAAEREVL